MVTLMPCVQRSRLGRGLRSSYSSVPCRDARRAVVELMTIQHESRAHVFGCMRRTVLVPRRRHKGWQV
jgi:hypothetical protein